MACKVRRDFDIITDVSSRVSLVTSNVRESSIRSPKSLYKKTSNEILAELKAVVKTGVFKGSGGPDPSYPSLQRPICYDKRVSNNQLSHTTHPVTTERKEEEGTFRVAVIIAE